jgi:hypothetical protein
MGYQYAYRLPGTNTFRSKSASTFGAKTKTKISQLVINHTLTSLFDELHMGLILIRCDMQEINT